MIKRITIVFLIIMCLLGETVQAMTFDNRYFPLFYRPYLRRLGVRGHAAIEPFFMIADRATGSFDEDIPLPDIDGPFEEVRGSQYDLGLLADALKESGKLDQVPFLLATGPHAKTASSVPFRRDGHLDGQGVAFYFEHYFNNCWSLGTSFFFMHVNARHEFCLDSSCSFPSVGTKQDFFRLKEELHDNLGVTPPLFSRTGFSDIDLFACYAHRWDYLCKFRSIMARFKAGIIIPTASTLCSANPASVIIGGNNHFGLYFDVMADFEVKEDWYFSLWGRAIKRLPHDEHRRIPAKLEPSRYGAIQGLVNVNPGWTFMVCPSVTFEGLREGLGARAAFTFVKHRADSVCDIRKDKTINVNLDQLRGNRSSWGQEYVSLTAFYDFAKFQECRSYLPTLSVSWDIPVQWKVSERSSKTNCVSIMVEADF